MIAKDPVATVARPSHSAPAASSTAVGSSSGDLVLECEQTISLDLERTFAFFADAKNLEAITPPWLRFRIVACSTDAVRQGTLIDYRLRMRGLPIRWRSEITDWEPPFRFVDEQRVGPYRRWVHEHTFEDAGEQTVVRDRVSYRVPGGRLVDRFLVRPDLERIFAFRRRRLSELLGT